MAETKPFRSLTLYDQVSLFPDGINSDVNPLLLPRTTLAWSINASVRGGYVKQRPPFINQTLTFPTTDIESGFSSGKFQGAGYLRPDFGSQQLVAQVSGRLFALTPNATGFDVAEVTIPGDPNDPNVTQVWMNQAEKWLIITDGTTALPIFYDGVSSRRSAGPSITLGKVTAVSDSTPAVGQTIEFTLLAPWTRPFGETVLFNGEFWQTIGSTATPSYEAILTNLTATPATTVVTGTDIVVKPQVLALTLSTVVVTWGNNLTVPVSTTNGFMVGQAIIIQPPGTLNSCGISHGNFSVASIDTVGGTVTFAPVIDSGCPPGVGTQTIFANKQVTTTGIAPDVVVATVGANFTVPAQGANVTAQLVAPYSGPANQAVWIGSDQWTITSAGSSGGALSLFMKSISATTTIPAIVPPDYPLILSVPELPAGRMGAYGIGHQAMSLLDGTSFLYGDTVGGPSGSATYSFRDAVLKTTENTFQAGGGSFRIPNTGEIITSMRFAAVLDAAYGQGPLQVGTSVSIFTCAVPTDRQTWVALENPILTETLIGRGPLAQNSTIPVNSDTFFRTTDGLGSMIFGRRDFVTWGNTPISAEVSRVTSRDDRTLLNYGSSVTFDNRFLGAASPTTAPRGISHQSILDMNFDPVSSLRGKAPSIWESQWTGLNVLQIINGLFNSNDRCFAFTYNTTLNKIELYEIMTELLQGQSGNTYDNTTTPITWELETASLFNRDVKPSEVLCGLRDGEFAVGNLIGTVRFQTFYKPDQHDSWIPWHSFSIVGTNTPTYYPRLGLGEPSPTDCISPINTPARDAHSFQFRMVITGTCTFFRARFAAVTLPMPHFEPPTCD